MKDFSFGNAERVQRESQIRVNCEQGDKGKQCWEMAPTAAKRIAWLLNWKLTLNIVLNKTKVICEF